MFLIEAHVHFEVSHTKDIGCSEVYNFPERGLLASLPFEAIKSLKNIFNKNVRQEVLTLTFNADSLMIKGEQVKTELTLKREAFDKHCYAHYIVGD